MQNKNVHLPIESGCQSAIMSTTRDEGSPKEGDAKEDLAMTKREFAINVSYTFDAQRKGAKYSFDGAHYMNAGEWKECLAKSVLGYANHKDANTAYNVGSDIPEIAASVKSSKASLTNMVLADTFSESVNTYFANVHSTCFIWVEVVDETVVLYMMNADEFRGFLYKYSALNERGVIRFKATSSKLVSYLDSLV